MSDTSTRREDLLTMVFGLWLVIGLFVDAFNHATNPELETFWTPWHAIFYSGFTATALWILRMSVQRRRTSGTVLDWAPSGYRAAIIGLAIFGAGGVGDALWHTFLGVETSLDALLSPTHLMLWIGALLILSAPIRAAWNNHDGPQAPTPSEFAPVTLSVMLTVSVVAFFFLYAWSAVQPDLISTVYVPETGRDESVAAYGILTTIVQTLILVSPFLVIRRRWTVPTGTATSVFTFAAIAMAYGFDAPTIGILPTILAGIALDLTSGRRRWLTPVVVPIVLVGGLMTAIGLSDDGMGWPPEVWSGSIVLCVIAATAFDGALDAVASLGRDRVTAAP